MAWFDCAVRRPIGANTGGFISPNLGLVLHHQAGNGSLFNFFNNPSAQVSAHFWVAKGGTIEQYVDTDVVAWHGRSLNSRYVGVETEGCATPPHAEPFTEAQINALARIYAEGIRRHGWLVALANADGQRGFGYHRMAVNTSCPCDVRLEKRTQILNLATGQAVPPPAVPKKEGKKMIAATKGGDGYWCVTHDGAIYAYGSAQNKGQPFGSKGGDKLQPGVTVVGIAGKDNDGYWLYASDGSVFAYGSAGFMGRPDRY